MEEINKILIVLDTYEETPDQTDSLPVEVIKALALIQNKDESQILLLSCGYEKFLAENYYSIGDELAIVRKEHCDRLKARLDTVSSRLKAQGFNVDTKLVWAFPRSEQIAKHSVDFGADIVIQHTRSYSKIARAFLTNDSWQLVRTCPKPLLLVKDRQWQSWPIVLAAVDPVHSHHKPLRLDHKIIAAAKTINHKLGGDLHVIHAYAEAGKPFALPEVLLEAHRNAFDILITETELHKENCHLVNDSPVIALQKYEKQLPSDVIVMGAISRTRLSDALIGNTAEQVLDYLESDVLIIKPKAIH